MILVLFLFVVGLLVVDLVDLCVFKFVGFIFFECEDDEDVFLLECF